MKKTIKLSLVLTFLMMLGVFSAVTASANDLYIKDGHFGYRLLSDYMTEDISRFSDEAQKKIISTRQNFKDYGIKYDDTDIILTWSDIEEGDLEIPSYIKGYRVVAIEENLYNLNTYSSISLPDTLKYLGKNNFRYSECFFTLSKALVYLGDNNISDGSQTLNIPSLVKYVGNIEASVSKITVESKNNSYIVDNGILYTKNMKKLVKVTNESDSVIKIPSTVTELQTYSFAHSTSAETVVVPSSVKALGNNVFYANESALRHIYMPKEIDVETNAIHRPSANAEYNLRVYSFGIGDIYNYVLERNVGQFGSSIILYNDLTKITYNDGKYLEYYIDENFNAIIKDCTAEDGENLGKLTIPQMLGIFKVAGCEDSAFEGQLIEAFALEGKSDCFATISGVLFSANKEKLICYPTVKKGDSYVVPTSTMTLGDYAFAYTKNLVAVALPKHINSYPWTVFKNCNEGIYIATIPDAVSKSTIKTKAIAYNSIELSWTTVTNISEYQIYRGTEPKTLTYLTTVKNMPYKSGSTCKYLDSTATLGIKYYYAIYPIKRIGASNSVSGTFSLPGVVGESALNVPTIKSISSPAYNKIKMTWNPIDGADQGYIIYRTTKSDNTGWKQIGKVTSGTASSYTDSTAVCGTKYYYTLRAVRGQIKSGYKKGGTACTAKLTTPKITSAVSASFSSVKLSWGKVSGASGYYLYRSTKNNSGWKKIATVSGGSTVTYTDKSLTCGSTYYYTLRAYRNQSGKTFTSGYVATGTAGKPVPAAPKLKTVTSASYNSLKVTWNVVSGANGYAVYRRVSGTKSWKYITTVGSATLSYVDKGLVCGTKYDYTVKAYKLVSSVKVWGKYSTTGISGTPIPATPNTLRAKVTNLNHITVSWNKVSGATGYYVYRKTSKTGWTKVGTVKSGSTLSFVDKSAQYNTTYTYTVRAYRTSNGVTTLSSYNSTGATCRMTYEV